MKLKNVEIHNIRSVGHANFELCDYSMLVGENNVGKTNILTALRLFYENGLKFNKDRDFPKFSEDGESWIELTFKTTENEQESLRDEYRTSDQLLKVRRYFLAKDKERVKSAQSNIYAYESGSLSTNLFYGAKNVSQAKLGGVLYVSATEKTNETMKLSGPSPFRDILYMIMRKAVQESPAFKNLREAFDKFDNDFRDESTSEGFSMRHFEHEIKSDIENWGIDFNLFVNAIKPEEIVKSLLSYSLNDKSLGGESIDISSYGQGFQRYLIFSMIRISAKYVDKSIPAKKDFDPDFNLLLFEEPEAFLHPSQQEDLCVSLRELSKGESEQVLISSHSPHFVSKQISNLSGMIRLSKDHSGMTKVFQITDDRFKPELNPIFS